MVALSGEQVWESNVRFARPGDPGDFVSHVGAIVGRTWQGPRRRLALSVAGDAMHFREQSDLNRVTYGASADASRQFSPRLAGQLGYVVRSALARDLAGAANAGVLLPLVLSRANSAAGLLSYRLSQRVAASVGTHYDRVTFDSRQLDDGWNAGGRVLVTRQTGRSGGIGGSYEFVRSSAQGSEGDAHTAAATWERLLGEHLGARLVAGATRLRPLGSGEVRTQPTGAAELRARSPHGAFTGRYDRSASQVFGFGRTLTTDHVSVAYDRDLTSALVLRGRAGYARSADPTAGDFRLTSQDYAVDARYALTRGLTLGGGIFLRRRDQGATTPPVASHGLALSLAYGRALP
jgi:hypothetical protein